MFGKKKKEVYRPKNQILGVALKEGHLERGEVETADLELQARPSKLSTSTYLARRGFLTEAEADQVLRAAEVQAPDAYILELVRRAREGSERVDTSSMSVSRLISEGESF